MPPKRPLITCGQRAAGWNFSGASLERRVTAANSQAEASLPRLTHLDVKHSDEVGPLRVVFDQTSDSTASLHPAAAPVGGVHLDHRRAQRLRAERTRR